MLSRYKTLPGRPSLVFLVLLFGDVAHANKRGQENAGDKAGQAATCVCPVGPARRTEVLIEAVGGVIGARVAFAPDEKSAAAVINYCYEPPYKGSSDHGNLAPTKPHQKGFFEALVSSATGLPPEKLKVYMECDQGKVEVPFFLHQGPAKGPG